MTTTTWRPRADAKIRRSYPTTQRLDVLALGLGCTVEALHLRAAQLGIPPRQPVRWVDTLPAELREDLLAGEVDDELALDVCAWLDPLALGECRLGALVRLALGEADTPEGIVAARRACEHIAGGALATPQPRPVSRGLALDGPASPAAPKSAPTRSGARWTDAEVAALVEELARPQPNLTRLAERLGRTACAVQMRAHKMRADRAASTRIAEEVRRVRLAVTERCARCRRVLACGSSVLVVGPNAYQCSGRCRQ